MMFKIFFIIITGYFLGSIPFGLIIAKIWNIDIRKYGSGNIGATNVFRILGPLPGTFVFALDFLKGVLAVQVGQWVGGDPAWVLFAGFFVILGHMFSVFLQFKGGKGVATGLGVLAAISPEVFFVALLAGGVILFTTRYVSVASIVTAFMVVVLMFVLNKPVLYTLTFLLLAVFVFIRHIPNVKRLLSGTELRIGDTR